MRLVEAEERAAISQLRIVEVEQELLGVRAELEAVTAAWHAAAAAADEDPGGDDGEHP